MPRTTTEGPDDDSLSVAVREDRPYVAPQDFRSSVRARLSSLVLGRESSLFSEVVLPSRRTASQVVLQVLDSLPFQLFSLVLVVFTLFAAVSYRAVEVASPVVPRQRPVCH
jgi:hypothetical protein